MKFDQALAVQVDTLPVLEPTRLTLVETNFTRISTDQELIQDTSSAINSYFKNGFPTSAQGLEELKEVLGLRSLYLDPDPNVTASDRQSLQLDKTKDKFLEKLTSKFEQGNLSDKDVEKLQLLNIYLRSGDQIAADFIMIDFDRKSIGQLGAVVKGHEHFQRLWKPEPSALSIDDQFQLVNARGTLTKLFQEDGLSELVIKQRLSEVFNIANQLSTLGVKVPEMVGFLVNDNRNTVHSHFSLGERFQFLASVAQLNQLPIPPIGLAPYVTNIFHSKHDVTGNMQEAIVAASLTKSGWQIRAMSQAVYSPRTELDLIARRDGIDYVIEVKTSTSTFIYKNDQRHHENQISNLLTHCDARHARLGIYCLDQPRVYTSGVIRAVTSALQYPEDAKSVFVITADGTAYDLEGQRVTK